LEVGRVPKWCGLAEAFLYSSEKLELEIHISSGRSAQPVPGAKVGLVRLAIGVLVEK
jgi:hypothetical protein